MASLVPDFECDIFISYRQKDNKHDGWVTEFVEHLKAELESTFKEEVSLYFDVNSHDGLLETHDVDASLREKLRCLVFIPVISRTYCDPKSFAWEHELKAFISLATQDRFGMKVTLHSGNVTSRILMIRIHELDPEDRELLEDETNGPLRSIDFIYREPGVNRPLTPADDENKNLNAAKYRNQINKTANAIKEIITAMQPEKVNLSKSQDKQKRIIRKKETGAGATDILLKRKPAGLKQGILLLTALMLFAAAIYAIYKFSGSTAGSGKSREKTIAVLPFDNIGGSAGNDWLGDVLTEAIVSQLSKIKELEVRSRTSLLQYKGTARPITQISREINANYIIEGSYQIINESYRITIKLLNARKDEQLWSEVFDGTWDDIRNMQTEIAMETADRLQAVLTPEEKASIEKDPTKNPGAYINFLSANTLSDNAIYFLLSGNKFIDSISFASAIAMYDKAIEADPLFALAYAKRSIARSWGLRSGQLDASHIEKSKADADRALNIENELAEGHIARGFYYYYCTDEYDEALKHFTLAADLQQESYQPEFYMAMVYRMTGDWEKSLALIRKVISADPQDALILYNIGLSFHYLHSYDSAMIFYRKAVKAMPDFSAPYSNMVEAIIHKSGNITEARKLFDSVSAQTGISEKYLRINFSTYEGRYSDALKEVLASTDADFGFPGSVYLNAGLLFRMMNDHTMARVYNDSALTLYKNQIMENPDNSYAYSCSGIAHAGSGNATDAIIAGKTAVELAGDNYMTRSDMIFNLAMIYILAGEYPDAIRQVEWLLTNPSYFSPGFVEADPVWKIISDMPAYKELTGKKRASR
jgi:TolB-like protein/Tfp pilus assembly protein PilF